jgi:sulfatase modifying factor 1
MKLLRVVGVFCFCVVASGFGQTNESSFFRISSPSNAFITDFDPSVGTLTCSNGVAGTTNQLQRSYDLTSTSNWVDFVQLVSNALVITESIIAPDSLEGMAFIPGGVFQMGDSYGGGEIDELPVHSVYVSGFYMDKYEVTKSLWDEVYNWATNNSYSFDNVGSGQAANHPVHTVSWYDCAKWCNARSEMEGRTPCYNLADWSCDFSANGYRLPTEAEWEKAARGGLNGRQYGWGDLIDHSKANYWDGYKGDSYPYSSPVGSFSPNGYGLYDMVGNMREWCGDWYGSTYYASSPSSNPRGASTVLRRVARGSGWDYSEWECRAAFRGWSAPDNPGDNLGFRAALPAK